MKPMSHRVCMEGLGGGFFEVEVEVEVVEDVEEEVEVVEVEVRLLGVDGVEVRVVDEDVGVWVCIEFGEIAIVTRLLSIRGTLIRVAMGSLRISPLTKRVSWVVGCFRYMAVAEVRLWIETPGPARFRVKMGAPRGGWSRIL